MESPGISRVQETSTERLISFRVLAYWLGGGVVGEGGGMGKMKRGGGRRGKGETEKKKIRGEGEEEKLGKKG